ncbi:response regulator transcription factor [Streptomyces sp. NPDC090106]|uniref:response regulator transcription factor n=1 Tax=Streptomyces sp. NPDC090106 TaxID=3365946 RepID=UPI00382F7383
MEQTAMILVVDDEPNMRELLSEALRMSGFDVVAAESGHEAVKVAEAALPALVVLDVMLPDLSGLEVARRMRERSPDLPIVFLTARDAVGDRIAGLAAGGDDYVTKPFSLQELVLRIRAILRRASAMPIEGVQQLKFADLELDLQAHEVRRSGRLIDLSPTEFRLLHYFLENAGRVVSRSQILDQVWKYDFSGDSRIVETYVYYLRKKIESDEPELIHTVRGIGYCLRATR